MITFIKMLYNGTRVKTIFMIEPFDWYRKISGVIFFGS